MNKQSAIPRMILIGGMAIMVAVWGLIFGIRLINSPEYIRKNIEKAIPEGAFLRDYKKLDNTGSTEYLVIYIEKGYSEDKIEPESMMSCPGLVTGQPIRGRYHLGLFKNNKFENSVEIPDNNYSDPEYQLPIVHRNIKGNIYNDLNRPDKFDTEVVPLLVMKDYTGDGKPYEFLLMTTEGGCGFWDGLVAGYDPKADKAIIYSDWIPRFVPDNLGNFHYLFDCGDHGNDIRVERDYVFNSNLQRFFMTGEKKTSCSA